jgi:predicted transcriptional regulator
VEKAIKPDHIISFEYKSLKRHFRTRGLTPEQYRQKWGGQARKAATKSAEKGSRSKKRKSAG